jgi:hypothetical protein
VCGHALLVVCSNVAAAVALPPPLARCLEAIAGAWIDLSHPSSARKVRIAITTNSAASTTTAASSSLSASHEPLPPPHARAHAERLVFHVWAELRGVVSIARCDIVAARCLHALDVLTTNAADADSPAAAAAILTAAAAAAPNTALFPRARLAACEPHLAAPASLDAALRRVRALCFLELDLASAAGVERAAAVVTAATHAHTHHCHGCPPLKDAIARSLYAFA